MATPPASQIDALVGRGLYTQALRLLRPRLDSRDVASVVLFAELLYRTEQLDDAAEAAAEALRLGSRDSRIHARANLVLGMAACRNRHVDEAQRYLEVASAKAKETADPELDCFVDLSSIPFWLDCHGVTRVLSLAADLRRRVLKTGLPHLFANLHVRFANIEMRRGDGDRAARHLDAAVVALREAPQSYITAQSLSLSSLINWLRDHVQEAVTQGRDAVKFATRDEQEYFRMQALSNLAQYAMTIGEFEECRRLLGQAIPLIRGENVRRCVLDTKAQLHLAEDDLEAAESCLREISPDGWEPEAEVVASWPDVEVNLTKVEVLRRSGDLHRALSLAEKASALARSRQEGFIEPLLTVQFSELLAESGKASHAAQVLGELVGRETKMPLHVLAALEKAKGWLERQEGREESGRRYFSRGRRLCTALGRVEAHRDKRFENVKQVHRRTRSNGWSAVEALALCMKLAGRPEIHGEELLEVLLESGAARRARLLSTRGASARTLSRVGKKKSNVRAPQAMVVNLGVVDGVSYELHVEPRPDIRSRSIVAAIVSLTKDSLALNHLRREAKQRESLWPVEEGLMLEENLFVAPRMRELHSMARRVGPSELPVLITGETGAGKEVIARQVHDASPRAGRGFGVLVCSGVPREMLDSHLFGHRRGAFTGAIENFLGVIRANEGGTLLLDEIGEVSLDLQVKLLRFLETGEVHPLGETRPIKVDVRIVAATNQPLETLMKEGRFRQDLFYRLNVVRLTIPPLRERREEILPFFERFLMRECARMGRPVPDVSDEAIEHLLLYTWPGNVRQLLNEVKRILATLPANAEITPAVLAGDITAERQAAIEKAVAASPTQMLVRTDQSLQAAIDQVERAMLKQALDTSPDLETAASRLDITRKGLFLKRQRLGLA